MGLERKDLESQIEIATADIAASDAKIKQAEAARLRAEGVRAFCMWGMAVIENREAAEKAQANAAPGSPAPKE